MSQRTPYERTAKKPVTKSDNIESAWFYVGREGIDVYVKAVYSTYPVVVRITRRQLGEFARQMLGSA